MRKSITSSMKKTFVSTIVFAVIVIAFSCPSFAFDTIESQYGLKNDSSLVLINDDSPDHIYPGDRPNYSYALGMTVNGGWYNERFIAQFESDRGYTYGGTRGERYVPTAPLATGYMISSDDHCAVTAIVKGDVLGTGQCNLSQLVEMTKILSQPDKYLEIQRMAADLNDDGKVTVSDIVQMVDIVTSIPQPLPAPELIQGPTDDDEYPYSPSNWADYFFELDAVTGKLYRYMNHPFRVELLYYFEDGTIMSSLQYNLEKDRVTKKGYYSPCYLDRNGDTWYTVSMETDDRELTLEEMNRQILEYVNDLRVREGKAPLELHPKLMEAASVRAKEKSRVGYQPAHTRPDKTDYYTVAENWDGWKGENGTKIYVPKTDRLNVLNAYANWYSSRSHRENMLDDRYKYMGFACEYDKDGRLIAYQLLGAEGTNNITAVDHSFTL